ncbi:MAG: hypothetical protein GF419_00540 [Ignavibacteriales bacterium]|nr:hypothetical protein [Ignavibacteriales bacterium]
MKREWQSFIKPIFENKTLRTILILGAAARLAAALALGMFDLDYYWEFGTIAEHLADGNGYSMFVFDGKEAEYIEDRDERLALESAYPVPSAYMPPAYPLYLTPFMVVESDLLRNALLIAGALAFYFLATLGVYKIALDLFDERVALWAAGFAAFLPDFIYSVNPTTSTAATHAVTALTVYAFVRLSDGFTWRRALLAGIFTAALIHLRMEMWAYLFVASAVVLVKTRQWKAPAVVVATVVLLAAPWQIRNYIVFDEYIPTTTAAGLNLYRGWNKYEVGHWGDDKMQAELKGYMDRKDYEARVSETFRREAIEYATERPAEATYRAFEKAFYFLVFDPKLMSAAEWLALPFHLVTFGLGIGGMLLFGVRDKRAMPALYFIISFAAAVAVFGLVRHQTLARIALVPHAAAVAVLLFERYGTPIWRRLQERV